MFAEKYLLKNNNKPLIDAIPAFDTGIIVIIPCFNEPNVLQTLNSLTNCILPNIKTEVIVVINHPENAEQSTKLFNRKTADKLVSWNQRNSSDITFHIVGPIELRKKWAGAGLARKSGMDEAIRRFNFLKKPNGIIVSLDADTLVETNYLVEIEKDHTTHPKQVGATIAFQHQADYTSEKHADGIKFYEKYLSYYKKALAYTGYPYSMFTIGSAFTVTAEAYVKRGGMNRRQAGEDFYFLQNLAQIGKIGEITSTLVHPSARLSDRVPFGTGPILRQWMEGKEDLRKTYAFESFQDLKIFFNQVPVLFKISDNKYAIILDSLPKSVGCFLKEDNFKTEIDDLNRNCSSEQIFRKRFFQKFNAFKILKYLNYVQEHFYPKADLHAQINFLVDSMKL